MKRPKKSGKIKKTAFVSAFAVFLNQSAWIPAVSAEELQYEGTTEMSTVDYSLEIDGVTAELVVEEVYVEAGEQIEEGSQILKLTSESYQEALDYYEAALIRAENTLTDTKREYDQGTLEAKSEYEMTKTEAEQADFVRSYQEEELEDTIAAYEEIQPEIEEKISEVQSGIDNGSYGSQASSGGVSFGGGGGMGGGMDSFGDMEEDGQDEKPDIGKEPGSETEAPGTEAPGTEAPSTETPGTEAPSTEAPGTEEPSTETPGTEAPSTETPSTEAPGTEAPSTETPGTEAPVTETPGTETPDETEAPDGGGDENENQDNEDFSQQVESLKEQIEASVQTYETVLAQMEAFLDGNDSGEAGSGSEEDALEASLRASIEGDTTISQHMKNVKEMAGNIPDAVKDAMKLAGIDYESYLSILDECITQIDTGISLQKNVLAVLEGEDENQQVVDAETVRNLLEQLVEAGEIQTSLYSQLVSLQESQISSQEETISSQEETISSQEEKISLQESQISSQKEEIQELQGQIDSLKTQLEAQQSQPETEQPETEQPGGTGQEQPETEQPGGTGQEQLETEQPGGTGQEQPETEQPGGTGQEQAGTEKPDGTLQDPAGNDSQTPPESEMMPDGTDIPKGGTLGDGNSMPGEDVETDGNGEEFEMPDSDGMEGEMENGGGSMGGAGSFGGGSMGGSMGGFSGGGSGGISSGITLGGSEDGTLTMEDLNLTEEDISLFGSTYDLSQVESLLDQEPMDSDNAQDLLNQLEEAAATVSSQYAELTRNRKATELEIQYTYETSVLAGKLAEITYEQELEEWEETLAEAENSKKELEEKKAALEKMTDGIVSSETGGTIAAVNYAADDVLNAATPVLTFYDTEKVSVTIAVPQEEIALLKVGDTVEATVAGRQGLSGTVTEKAMEEQEGNSRTTVNYEVTITIENENGRLSAGSSANVTVDTTSEETAGSEEDSQNE